MTDTLIARLESADGPSRELDAEIFIAACHPTWRIQTECKLFPEQVQTGRIQEPDGCGWRNAPAYTASLDAALTLVPEGWSAHLHTSEDRPDCEIHITVNLGRSYPTNKAIYSERSGVGSFGMVALALAAAALKARGV